MRKAFICYANENETFARLAEMMLIEAGYDVWLDDRKVRGGEEWRKAIDDGISASDVLLVVLTPESCESQYVTYEWAFALGKGTKVIPLLVEDAELHPRLAVLQHLDFTNKKTMPWARLFQEIDIVKATPESTAECRRVGDMTAEQLQDIIAGAVSLATASAKSSESSAAPEDILRTAKSFVDLMQDAAQPASAVATVTNRLVLWVDDQPDNNIYERRAFESMGLEFALARSTKQALAILSDRQFAMVISDLGRPEGPEEGYSVLDQLRRTDNETPFFIYTGSNAKEHEREAKERGAQGVTNNPQELFELVTSRIALSDCQLLVANGEDCLRNGEFKRAYDSLKSAQRKLNRLNSDNVPEDAGLLLSRIQYIEALMAKHGK